MLIDEIKSLIHDLEEILIQDPRFKKDIFFKKKVKKIYGTKIIYGKNKTENFYVPYIVNHKEEKI
jgi:hypothetical protein